MRLRIADLKKCPALVEKIAEHLPKHQLVGTVKRRYSELARRGYLTVERPQCAGQSGAFFEERAIHSRPALKRRFRFRVDQELLPLLRESEGWGVYDFQ